MVPKGPRRVVVGLVQAVYQLVGRLDHLEVVCACLHRPIRFWCRDCVRAGSVV